jgi:hypothetical protein
MATVRWRLLTTLLMLPLGGCVATPQVLCPGSEAQQVRRAQKFDPFPERGVAPDVVGARPAEFADPPAQVLHVQRRLGDGLQQ